MKYIFGLIFLLTTLIVQANPQSPSWYTQNAAGKVALHVDLFISSTCPHCIKADAFFHEIEKNKPWIKVHRYVINQDRVALETFHDRLQQNHLSDFSVPAIFFCGARWTGFADAKTTGKALVHSMSYCRKKISQQGELSPSVIRVLQKDGDASRYQYGKTMAQSASSLIVLTALMDGASSCSLFCLLAFLAFLWLFPTQKRLQLTVGLVFLLSLAIVHYMQQVHPTFYYQMASYLILPIMLVGIALMLMVFDSYRKLKSRDALKSRWFILGLVFATVFAVQVSQQTCSFNVAVVFQQWWVEHPVSYITQFIYQIAYQVVYVLPLAVLLMIHLVIGRHEQMTPFQRRLAFIACLMLMSIGMLLLVYPQGLANVLLSVVVSLVSTVVGWFLSNRYRDE